MREGRCERCGRRRDIEGWCWHCRQGPAHPDDLVAALGARRALARRTARTATSLSVTGAVLLVLSLALAGSSSSGSSSSGWAVLGLPVAFGGFALIVTMGPSAVHWWRAVGWYGAVAHAMAAAPQVERRLVRVWSHTRAPSDHRRTSLTVGALDPLAEPDADHFVDILELDPRGATDATTARPVARQRIEGVGPTSPVVRTTESAEPSVAIEAEVIGPWRTGGPCMVRTDDRLLLPVRLQPTRLLGPMLSTPPAPTAPAPAPAPAPDDAHRSDRPPPPSGPTPAQPATPATPATPLVEPHAPTSRRDHWRQDDEQRLLGAVHERWAELPPPGDHFVAAAAVRQRHWAKYHGGVDHVRAAIKNTSYLVDQPTPHPPGLVLPVDMIWAVSTRSLALFTRTGLRAAPGQLIAHLPLGTEVWGAHAEPAPYDALRDESQFLVVWIRGTPVVVQVRKQASPPFVQWIPPARVDLAS